MPVYIYALLDPETNLIRYIGKSVEPASRFTMHIFHATHGADTHKDRWIRQLLAKGLKPVMQIVEETNEADWQDRERYWIAFYRAQGGMTNITDGGTAITAPRTEVWASRISQALTGREVSQETRQKLSAVNIAKNDAGCKNGHLWTPENTHIVNRNGQTYRACKTCAREWQAKNSRAKGIPTKEEHQASKHPKDFCKAGHSLSGDNLRLLERKGYTERICRECVRIRNRNSKQRKKENN